jgi:hypothetical protein
MVLAHSSLIKRRLHKVPGDSMITFMCLWALHTGAAPAISEQTLADNFRALSGYVSQEKRFLMYLFNGNAGKVQVA